MTSASPLISARDISLKDGDRTLLQQISLSIHSGEIITLIGPNGAGKTTLLNILLGLRKPTSGSVNRLDKLRIGYMPQRLQLNPQLPLNVERFLALAHDASPIKGSAQLSIDTALERTGVSHLKKSEMQNLSGGELQRVLLARALLRKPQLLVLDEPVQGVDVSGQNKLYQLINDLRKELNCGVLMVSHDLHLVMAATDHVICLNQHICCHGHPESVSNHPAYLELFGHSASNLATYTHHHDHSHNLHGEVVKEDNKKQSTHQHCNHGDH
ncbi:MAG: zinc ABC transporter ATP-binding protein ZnuC [Cellvibrionaceae bacterium]